MRQIIICTMLLTLLSCSKDDEVKRDALTIGTWKLTGNMFDHHKDGVYEEDIYPFLEDCSKDNTYTFQVDGNEIIDEGPTKCDSIHPQTRTLSWSFNDDLTQLQIGVVNYHIEILTAATLQLRSTESYNAIFTMHVRSTYTKQ